MRTRIINWIENTTSKLQIKDTDHTEVKELKYTTEVMEWTGFIEAYRALMLEQMQVIIWEDWIDSVTIEVIRMDSMGEIAMRIEDIINK